MGCGKSTETVKPVLVPQDARPSREVAPSTINKGTQERDETVSKEEQNAPQMTSKPSSVAAKLSDLANQYRLSDREATLRIEYIYGYNCFSSRHNLFYLSASDIVVYPCGGLAVLLSVSSNTQRFLGGGEVHRARGHIGAVVSIAVSRDRDLIATGEKSDSAIICLWKLPGSDPVKILEIPGHTKGTELMAFATDSKYIATVDCCEEQTIRVFDVKTGDLVFQSDTNSGHILSLQWSPKQPLFLTVGAGHFQQFLCTSDHHFQSSSFLSASDPRSMTVVRFFPNGECVTGSTAGKLYHWSGSELLGEHSVLDCAVTALYVGDDAVLAAGDVEKIYVLDGKFKEKEVISTPGTPISLDMSANGIICGTLDGSIIEFGRNGRIVLMDAHSRGDLRSITLDPGRGHVVLSAGSDNKVRVWDLSLRKCVVSGILEVSEKTSRSTAIAASSTGHIAIGHEDGHFTVRMNAYQLNNILAMRRGEGAISKMRYQPDGAVLAVGREIGKIELFDSKRDYQHLLECTTHKAKIVSLDFSESKAYYRSQDSSLRLLFWKVSSGKPVTASSIKSESWASDTTLRSPASETQALACSKSPAADIYVQGTAAGVVEMYSSTGKVGPTAYKAHAVEVAAVLWTLDGSCVVTAGGSDLSLVQWRLA